MSTRIERVARHRALAPSVRSRTASTNDAQLPPALIARTYRTGTNRFGCAAAIRKHHRRDQRHGARRVTCLWNAKRSLKGTLLRSSERAPLPPTGRAPVHAPKVTAPVLGAAIRYTKLSLPVYGGRPQRGRQTRDGAHRERSLATPGRIARSCRDRRLTEVRGAANW
jgi:hypothetical protein